MELLEAGLENGRIRRWVAYTLWDFEVSGRSVHAWNGVCLGMKLMSACMGG